MLSGLEAGGPVTSRHPPPLPMASPCGAPASIPLPLVSKYVDEMVTVEEEE